MKLFRYIVIAGVLPLLVLGLHKEAKRTRRASGPQCYGCLQTNDPGQCTKTVHCEEDEICYVEKLDIGGGVSKYNMGCMRRMACSFFHGAAVVGKRNTVTKVLDKRVTPVCSDCCDGDHCNTNQCGGGSPSAVPTVPAQAGTYVRLVNGPSPFAGRVEVYHNGQWGSICDDHWSGNDASVVCGMLGYSREGSAGVPVAQFGSAPSFAAILLDDVQCQGTEVNIAQCQHRTWGTSDCSHREDAGVECNSVGHEDNLIFILDTGVGGRIYKMDIDTQSFGTVPMNNLYHPTAIDYDPTEGRIYFVDSLLQQIASVHYSGTDIREIKQINPNSDLEKIEVDPINKKIFYADTGNDQIGSLNFDGSGYKIVANGSIDKPRDVVSDPSNRVVYWTDWGSTPKIEMANYDGSGRQVIASGNMKWPNGLALDYSERKLYFCDGGTDRIEVMSTDGSNRKTVFSSPGTHMYALSLYKQYIYYTDWTKHTVMRVNKDGTGNTAVGPPAFRELGDIRLHKYGYGMPGLTTSSPLALDESHIFVALGGTGNHNEGLVEVIANGIHGTICDDNWDNNDAAVICNMLGFGSANAVATSNASYGSDNQALIFLDEAHCTGSESHIAQCTQVNDWGVHDCSHSEDAGVRCQFDPSSIKSFILIADSAVRAVFRMDMETGSYAQIPNSAVANPIAIDYDPVRHKVYYSDVRLGVIRSTNLDGTGEQTVANLGLLATPDGLAVDEVNQLIFYTDTGHDVIGKMGLDGSNAVNITTSSLDEPRAITLDKGNRKVYWSDWGANPKIESSNYDGSGRVTIVHGISLKLPNGLVYDAEDKKLYFCDAGTNKIESMNTDGSERKVVFEDKGAHYFGLDTDSQYIYFSDWTKDGVLRIKKDGTGETTIGPPNFGRLNGIAIYQASNW